jgi:tetratricopeptide (TPR) repeat protein
MLENQFGSHPEIDSRRAQLQAAAQNHTEPAAEFDLAPESLSSADQRQAHEDLTSFEFEAVAADNESASQPVSSSPSQSRGPVFDSGLAEVFEEFKIAAEGESSSDEDYETHYNMGTAYKEMDLLDEAIQEYQTAATLSKPGDGTPRYLQCCNMLGHCFLQKNLPRAAVPWFRKGLESPGHSADEYLALRYELGSAYEQMGDINRALDVFTEVYGENVSYREVAEKLRALQEQKSSKSKKRKK